MTSESLVSEKVSLNIKWHITFLCVLVVGVSPSCPKSCQCKWRDGKEWATCVEGGFIDIPRYLENSTQVLNLRGNTIKYLIKDAFVDIGLVNLQKIFLTNCNLQKLFKGSLRKLANLVELDLSYNFLKEIPSEALADVPGLRELNMKNNSITYIHPKAFYNTSEIVELDLSYNAISSLDDEAFISLTKLKVLELAGNKLSTLRADAIRDLSSLRGLYIHANLWNCDCNLRPLRYWMEKRKIAISVPPTCLLPKRLQDRQWKTLELDEFVCIPHVTAVAQRILASNGDNVSLACRVETDPVAQVTWLIGNRPVARGLKASQPRYKVLVISESGRSSRLSNLTIEGADLHDQGTYRCVAENKAGRVETNLTLKVSEVKSEEIIEMDQVFVAGALIGALAFILFTIIVACAVFYKRKRRHAQNLASIVINADPDINSPARRAEQYRIANQKDYVDYKMIPTSDNETDYHEEREQILNNDTQSANKHRNNPDTETNGVVTIDKKDCNSPPSADQSRSSKVSPNRPEDPLLQDLAQQCKDEVLRRQKKTGGGLASSIGHFPDLLSSQSGDLQYCTMPRRNRIIKSDSSSRLTEELTSSSYNLNNRVSLPPLYETTPRNVRGQLHLKNRFPPTYQRTPSLPSTPLQSESHQFLWDKRFQESDISPIFNYEYHANQLEHFLREYKNLQEELYRMKETAVDAPCDEEEKLNGKATGNSDWLSCSGKESPLYENQRRLLRTDDSSRDPLRAHSTGGFYKGGNGQSPSYENLPRDS